MLKNNIFIQLSQLSFYIFVVMATMISKQSLAGDSSVNVESVEQKQNTQQQDLAAKDNEQAFFYLGGKLGINRYQHACQSWRIDCDKQDIAGGLFAGYQLNENLSLEAAYLDLGEAVATYLETGLEQEYTGTMQGFELSALASLPLSENFAVFAKGGALNWSGKNKSTAITLKANGWSPMAGLGLTYQFAQSWQARLEYQYFHEVGNETLGGSNAHLTTLGISYQFGRSDAPVKEKQLIQQKAITNNVENEPVSQPSAKSAPVVIAVKPKTIPQQRVSILFAFDGSKFLHPKALDAVVARLVTYQQASVSLKGYTDSKGSSKYNLMLSKRRVDAISQYLIAQGVKRQQIRSEYFGKKFPLFDNLTAEHQGKNRRVLVFLPEITISADSTQGVK